MKSPIAQKSSPTLIESQLKFRIGLARKRTTHYPLDSMDFIMQDLERPDMCSRHADWCTGDLTGRLLEFLSAADTVDGVRDPRLGELFERIFRTRRPSGLFGLYGGMRPDKLPPEDDVSSGAYRIFNGLLKYYHLTGDHRALDAARDHGDWFVKNKDLWLARYNGYQGCALEWWITEPLAELFHVTGEQKYLDFIGLIDERITTCQNMHSHGFLATMRGLQLAAIYTGDSRWNEKPRHYGRLIVDDHYEYPDGCITEYFPRGFRNEGCSIADWLMFNLNAGLIENDDAHYARAQNILWNALFFNQFVTGGLGHRDMTAHGYAMGPISEAWWCCTHHGGYAMSEYARHAVTLRDRTVQINLLTPGRFQVGDIEVTISTEFPSSADAIITVANLPADTGVQMRLPDGLRNATTREENNGRETRIFLRGEIGHYLQPCENQVMLKYGPVILAPHINYWRSKNPSPETNVPAGYVPDFLPGNPILVPGPADQHGFLQLAREPIPHWSYFDLGPGARSSVDGASVHVPVEFEDGQTRTLWFAPLCHATSNLSYYETPFLFTKK